MQNRLLLGLLSLSLFMAGCTSIGAKYPSLTTHSEPYAYMDQYIKADEVSVINPLIVLGKVGIFPDRDIKDYPDHRIFNQFWCSKTGVEATREKVENICNLNKGVMSNGWCIHYHSKQKIFYARIYGKNFCSNAPTVAMEGMFPAKGQNYTSDEWQSFLKVYFAQVEKLSNSFTQSQRTSAR